MALSIEDHELWITCFHAPIPPDLPDSDTERVLALLRLDRPVRYPGEADGWTVYTMRFECGAAYVGITLRSVAERVEAHIGKSWQEATFAIQMELAAGHTFIIEVIASGLSKQDALERERVEIAALEKPLNVMGATRGYTPCGTLPPEQGAVARLFG